jgi:secondary thiamine-phosphate synthase enzyme
MGVFQAHLTHATRARVEVANITPSVREALAGSTVRDGILCVSTPHTTCGLALNEDEEGLRRDFARLAGSLLDPLRAAGAFHHDAVDDNAQAHLTASLFGPSLVLPFIGGAPSLGTWQSILLVEIDGPRTRRIDMTVVG